MGELVIYQCNIHTAKPNGSWILDALRLRFDLAWREALEEYECEQDAAQLDMRFDVVWEGHCWQYLWENKQAAERKRGRERVVTDGEW